MANNLSTCKFYATKGGQQTGNVRSLDCIGMRLLKSSNDGSEVIYKLKASCLWWRENHHHQNQSPAAAFQSKKSCSMSSLDMQILCRMHAAKMKTGIHTTSPPTYVNRLHLPFTKTNACLVLAQVFDVELSMGQF